MARRTHLDELKARRRHRRMEEAILAEARRREAINEQIASQIASKVTTQPIPTRTARRISNKSTAVETNISNIETPTSYLVLDLTPPFDNTTHPPEFIDGVSLDADSAPGGAFIQTRSSVVSISQRSTDDDTKRKIIKSVTGEPPEILSSVRLPFFEFSAEEIDDCLEVGQFERQILKEAIIRGVSAISSKDPSGRYTAAKKESKNNQNLIQKQTESISDMLSAASTAATGLNILRMSPQIMQRAAETVAPLVFDTESSKRNPSEALPAELDEYIKLTYPGVTSVDDILTNTSRIILIMQDMLMSSLSVHPALLGQFSRSRETKTLFSVAENFAYDLDGVPQDSDRIPTVDKVFFRNKSTVSRAFIDSSVGVRPVTGLLNEGRYSNASTQWDIITHLVSSLSNEMILSAGVGRLLGSQLGNKFLQASSTNGNQYAPFDRVFGDSPTANAETISRFFQTGLGRTNSFEGSFLDYMALGEETSSRSFIVMPFEVDTVIDDSRIPYASGKKYFIDLALQEVNTPAGAQSKRSALKTFSNQYQSFTSEVSSYLTEILSLGVDTKLSPQILFARILQDFRAVTKSMSAGVRVGIGGDQSNIKSLTAASLFASLGSGYQKLEIATKSIDSSEAGRTLGAGLPEYIGPVRVSSRDVLKMSVVKAYRDLLEVSPDEKSTLDKKNLSILTSNEISAVNSSAAPGETLRSGLTNVYLESIINNNLSEACKIMLEPSEGGITVIDSSGAARGLQIDPGALLHDSEFDVKDNIINLIAKLIREIEKESYNLATREGSSADYRNSRGNTLMSDCNIDRLIDVVCEIYIRLSPMLLPFVFSPVKEGELRTRLRGGKGFTCSIDVTRSEKAEKVIDLIVYKLSRGESVTIEDLESQPGVSRSDSIGNSVAPNSIPAKRFGPIPGIPFIPPQASDGILNISEIVSRTNRLSSHRYYIKTSLKIIESVSQCVSSSSSRISRIFDILQGSTKDNLSDSEKTLYDMFVTNKLRYQGLLESLDDYQANLCTAARYTQNSANPVFLRRDIDTSRSERLAVRDYIRSLISLRASYDDGGGDLHLVSVGIPDGTIGAITSTSFGRYSAITSDFRLGLAGTEAQDRTPVISIDILRHDQSRVTHTSDGLTTLRGDAGEKLRVYDPEIFIFPDSITYDPSTLEPNSDPTTNAPGSILDKILISTKFYRLKSGRVTETVQGSRNLPPQYRNALVSYLLDLYMYDSLRIRYNDGLGPVQNSTLSQSGYLLMNEISSSPDLSLLVMNRQGFSKLVDAVSLQLKRDADLLEMITKRNIFVDPEFTLDNYKMATILSCVNIMSDMSYVIAPRSYERIYHFLHDEKTLQNNIADSTERFRRKKMDIFTLSTTLRHIG